MKRKSRWLTEPQWLDMRKQYLTATAVASVLGLDPYCSPNKAVNEKNRSSFMGNAYSLIGELLEEPNIRLVNVCLKREFEGLTRNNWAGTKKVWFTFCPDIRLAATPDAREHDALLECKTTKPRNYTKWLFSPPLKYVMQLHVQLLTTNKSGGLLSIMSTNLSQDSPHLNAPISVFDVKRNDEIEKYIIEAAEEFWDAFENKKTLRVNAKRRDRVKTLLTESYKKVY